MIFAWERCEPGMSPNTDCIRYEIGSRIKQLRIKKGLSQEKLAELAELNMSYIGQVERGEKNPSVETVYRICRAMDADMSQLFKNLTSAQEIENQYPQAVYSMMLNMDEDLCKCLFSIATALAGLNKNQ